MVKMVRKGVEEREKKRGVGGRRGCVLVPADTPKTT